MHFVVYMIKTDQISFFNMPQNELVNDYLEFCRSTSKFLNNKNAVEYLEFIMKNNINDETGEENLNFWAQNFFQGP